MNMDARHGRFGGNRSNSDRWRRPHIRAAAGLVVLLLATATAPAQIDPSPFSDGSDDELVEVAVVFSRSSAGPGQTYDAAAVVTIEPGWHINSADPYQSWLIPAELAFDTIPGLIPDSILYPDGIDANLLDEMISVYGGRTIVRFRVTVEPSAGPGEYELPVRFTYQLCNDRQCLPPRTAESRLRIEVDSEGTPMNAQFFADSDAPATQGIEPPVQPTEESDLQRLIGDYGFWGYFLALGLAFVTGLLLSFSPCTYPMIPITVSIFAGQNRTVGKGFALSLVYVGSMAVVYGIMGLVVSLVGGVFGAWMASPPVVIGIAAVLAIFSLSMFGLYELQVPASLRQKLGTAKGGGGVLSTMVLGVVAALVVSPCVGPFVAGILLYIATAGSPLIGFLVLFVFAVGLGTLYVIIGTFSSAINRLPGSGEWMESVKKFFGFVLLLMALYFLQTIMSVTLMAVLVGLLLLAYGVFGGGLDRLTPEAGFFPRLKKFLGVLAFVVGLYLLAGTLITQGLILPPVSRWLPAAAWTASETDLIDWQTDLETGLARAKAEGRPVLIDTWATWCVNCRILDKRTFGHPDVAAEAERFVAIKVQLETAGSETTRQFMARFGMKHYSLPTTLLLNSSGQVQRILKGVVSRKEMIAEMRKVR